MGFGGLWDMDPWGWTGLLEIHHIEIHNLCGYLAPRETCMVKGIFRGKLGIIKGSSQLHIQKPDQTKLSHQRTSRACEGFQGFDLNKITSGEAHESKALIFGKTVFLNPTNELGNFAFSLDWKNARKHHVRHFTHSTLELVLSSQSIQITKTTKSSEILQDQYVWPVWLKAKILFKSLAKGLGLSRCPLSCIWSFSMSHGRLGAEDLPRGFSGRFNEVPSRKKP